MVSARTISFWIFIVDDEDRPFGHPTNIEVPVTYLQSEPPQSMNGLKSVVRER